MLLILACGCRLLKIYACNKLGIFKSSKYVAFPVISFGSSLRFIRCPTSLLIDYFTPFTAFSSLIISDALLTAFTINSYPVQRQITPSNPSLISSSVGVGFCANNSILAIIAPGVQYPHCNPCSSQNPRCTGCKFSTVPKPSTVISSDPSTWTANKVQDFAARPSTKIVQFPHWLVSQPICEPVIPNTSRIK